MEIEYQWYIMRNEISFHKVLSNERNLIELIAGWYSGEWNIPLEFTHQRLANMPNDQVILQLLLLMNDEPVATGGLYYRVGLLNVYPEFANLKPWIALLFTTGKNRNKGYGQMILYKLEDIAKDLGFNELYLHTYTAEKLYSRNNWKTFERVAYKGHTTAIMKKGI
jgi:GNAT superfamily N-acetyltransferase